MDNIFLSEAINDYPFPGADLNGCINDQLDLIKLCQPLGVIIENYKNEESQHDVMLGRIKRFAKLMTEGSFTYHYSAHGTYGDDPLKIEPDGLREGLYPWDGKILWDYELIEAFSLFNPKVNILIILDSCFSGGMSRLFGDPLVKSRYYQTSTKTRIPKGKVAGEKINGVLISGCGEGQTSADAYINGKYNGALSFYMAKMYANGISQRQWYEAANKALIKFNKFDQRPELLGTGNPDTGCFGQPIITTAKKGCLLKFLPI
jgi:hypothetical protein